MKGVLKTVESRLYMARTEDGRFTFIDGRDSEVKSGLSPMETFLFAAAACSAVDIEVILRKRRCEVKSLEIHIEARRREEYPKIWEYVKYTYVVRGRDISEKDVKKAIELSLGKYCSASITLMEAGAKIEWDYRIEEG